MIRASGRGGERRGELRGDDDELMVQLGDEAEVSRLSAAELGHCMLTRPKQLDASAASVTARQAWSDAATRTSRYR